MDQEAEARFARIETSLERVAASQAVTDANLERLGAHQTSIEANLAAATAHLEGVDARLDRMAEQHEKFELQMRAAVTLEQEQMRELRMHFEAYLRRLPPQ
jgi:septal ring factor EnvC (AmiA/AmiB activator)